MQRAKLRNYALVILVILAAASMFPSFGGDSRHRPPPRPHKPQTLAAKPHANTRATFGIHR
jgi:hypothetical protein